MNRLSNSRETYHYIPSDAFMRGYLNTEDLGIVDIPTSFPQVERFSFDFIKSMDGTSRLKIRAELNITNEFGQHWKSELRQFNEISNLQTYNIGYVLKKWVFLAESPVFAANSSEEFLSQWARMAIMSALHIFRDVLEAKDETLVPVSQKMWKDLRYIADVERILGKKATEAEYKNASPSEKESLETVTWDRSEAIRLKHSKDIMKRILRKASDSKQPVSKSRKPIRDKDA